MILLYVQLYCIILWNFVCHHNNNNAFTLFQISELASLLYNTQTQHEDDLAEKEILSNKQNSEIVALKEGLVRTGLSL
jgi:hypothetical protein